MTAAEAAKVVNETFRGLGLICATPEAIANVPLPASSGEYLLTGGLPAGDVFGVDFEPARNLPTAAEYAAARGYPATGGGLAAARCIGDSWGVLFVLDLPTWRVRRVDTRGKQDEMFVNTNVESLGASLAAYASLAPLRDKQSPSQLSVRLRQMLLQIDAPCIEGWWSTVIQEIEYGLS